MRWPGVVAPGACCDVPVTSPDFFTVKGLSIAVALLGLLVVFLSVARERYHESKSDPYKGVKQ